MNKRIIIVHGWGGTPEEAWFPWLKKNLEQQGYTVVIPQLPDTHHPRIQNWVPALSEAVGTADEQTYFVGHSMGCQTIARYIEALPAGTKVGGAVFVAGFFKSLTGMEDDADVQATDKHWLDAPVDLELVKTHLPKSIAIFSDDDPYVPMENIDDFRVKLGSEIIVEHNKGHFSGDLDKAFEVPVILEKVLGLLNIP